MHSNIINRMKSIGIVPIVTLNDASDAKPLADALVKGGMPCAEITFRTPCAEECINIMTRDYPEMLIGAGTVVTIEQIDCAVAAGAKFIVSPGFSEEIVDYCLKKNILVLPGCITPTEAIQAVKKGIKVIKFFPSEQFGGLATLKALSAPYTDIRFMPTGGINPKNVRNYLAYDRVVACGGSWMVHNNLIKEGSFEKITELVKEAAEIVKEVRR